MNGRRCSIRSRAWLTMRDNRAAVPLWVGIGLVLTVQGRSMEPTLCPGDVVLAIRQHRPFRVNQVALVSIEGSFVVKRIAIIEGSWCYLGVESPFGWVPTRWLTARIIAALGPGYRVRRL